MKGTERFKETIKNYLDELAKTDELFAKEYAKEGKNIDDCIKFILSEVKKSGCCGFSDDEIFGLALHYYTEDNVEISNIGNCQVVVNHHVELTEEEIKEAKEKAMQQVMKEEAERIRKPKTSTKPKAQTETAKQPELSLFDF